MMTIVITDDANDQRWRVAKSSLRVIWSIGKIPTGFSIPAEERWFYENNITTNHQNKMSSTLIMSSIIMITKDNDDRHAWRRWTWRRMSVVAGTSVFTWCLINSRCKGLWCRQWWLWQRSPVWSGGFAHVYKTLRRRRTIHQVWFLSTEHLQLGMKARI